MYHGIKTLRECACEELKKAKKLDAKEANSISTHAKEVSKKRKKRKFAAY
jgi:hypothetical protein